jgi:hypothetical protein
MTAAAALLLATVSLAAAGCGGSVARTPAITASPTGVEIPGKVVWLDLLTDDLEVSKRFYGQLFGWSFAPVDGVTNYVTIRLDGEPIGGMLEIEPKKHGDRVAQWLSYISVADVDDAVALYEKHGGELHYGPLDIPGRGRAALVTDAQGAYVALLRSSTGDPPDGAIPGERDFMWVDYIADDTDAAAEFLSTAFGWKSELRYSTERGDYFVFSQGDEPRAGMIKNPWEHVRPNWLPYVRVGNADDAVKRAEQLGGTVVLAPREDVRNGSVGIVLDPSGAGLVLQKYPFEEAES